MGSAIVSIASSRRPADCLTNESNSLFSEPSRWSNAFGGTPKAADEDVRAPRSIWIDTAYTLHPEAANVK
jgi:hypothetical protein